MSPETIQLIRQLFDDVADIDHAVDNLKDGVAHLVTTPLLPNVLRPGFATKTLAERKESHVYISADVARDVLEHMRRRLLRRLETYGLILEPERDLIGRLDHDDD